MKGCIVTTEERIAKIEARLPSLASEASLERLRADMFEVKADLIKWIVATMFAAIVAASAIAVAAVRIFGA